MATGGVPAWVPQSCSLPAADQPLRVAEFDRLFDESVARCSRVSATRLDVVLDGVAEDRARELAARESACCSFFVFGFEPAGPNVVMSIEVPDAQTPVLSALATRLRAVTGE
jgi:hypothetical protein